MVNLFSAWSDKDRLIQSADCNICNNNIAAATTLVATNCEPLDLVAGAELRGELGMVAGNERVELEATHLRAI